MTFIVFGSVAIIAGLGLAAAKNGGLIVVPEGSQPIVGTN